MISLHKHDLRCISGMVCKKKDIITPMVPAKSSNEQQNATSQNSRKAPSKEKQKLLQPISDAQRNFLEYAQRSHQHFDASAQY